MQVYRKPTELARSVGVYLAAGFDVGEPGVAVVTEAHRPLVLAQLEERGWVGDELVSSGLLFLADAETTLAAVMEGAKPSPGKFSAVVGALIDQAAANSPSGHVRVFGEMVDVLCRRNESAAAEALEQLWNRLGSRKDFSLLCGYKVDVFDRTTQVDLLPQICRAHSHVLPDGDGERMEQAVNAALIEALGTTDAQKVHKRAARHASVADDRIVPASQLALMWVSAHMPLAADRILAAARSHYLGLAA